MSHLYREQRRILLVDDNTRKLDLRATVLRNHEIEVHTCGDFATAAPLWRTVPYDLVLLAIKEDSEQVTQITAEIRQSKPRQRIGLLVGPPSYIRELTRTSKTLTKTKIELPPDPIQSQSEISPGLQWQRIVQKVVTGWYSEEAALLDRVG